MALKSGMKIPFISNVHGTLWLDRPDRPKSWTNRGPAWPENPWRQDPPFGCQISAPQVWNFCGWNLGHKFQTLVWKLTYILITWTFVCMLFFCSFFFPTFLGNLLDLGHQKKMFTIFFDHAWAKIIWPSQQITAIHWAFFHRSQRFLPQRRR